MKPGLLFILFFLPVFGFSQITKILFVGNSYTYTNNLPQLLYDISLSHGDTVLFDSSAPGSYTFQNHSTDVNTLAKINSRQWDYVVLQEQSQIPAFSPAQVATDCYPYAHTLDSLIFENDSCSQTIFYMTWGRKFGDASNCASYPPICTYAGMQQRLYESYLDMANSNHATVAPVGAAWRNSINTNSTFDLFSGDNSHPNIQGSYLAACVFYSTIFKKSSIGTTFISSLSSSDAAYLQGIADHTVFDSVSTWMLYADYPKADFSADVTGATVQFTNSSPTGSSFFWDFGDGGNSIIPNPTHIYSANGTYSVTCIASNTCFTDTFSLSVTLTSVGLSDKISSDRIVIFPNPSSDFVTLHSDTIKNARIEIITLLGEMIDSKFVSGNSTLNETIDLSFLPKGVFLIKVIDSGSSYVFKCVRI